jgi:hypothetical protein
MGISKQFNLVNPLPDPGKDMELMIGNGIFGK